MRHIFCFALFCFLSWPLCAAELDTRPHVDVVFAIDCSGSMGGVIHTAKQKIWSIVNEIAKAKPTPVLRIGLHGYGDGERTFRNYPLTDDLDQVYADLMTFKDEGWGSEYVGLSVQKTTQEMDWKDWEKTGASNVLRVLYVVGNETAEQGQVSYKTSAPEALKKQIFVNAIYCGYGGGAPRVLATPSNAPLPVVPNNPPNVNATNATRRAPTQSKTQSQQQATPAQNAASTYTLGASRLDEIETWKELARLGGGEFSQIAASGGGVTVPTPYDKEFVELNTKLNGTYIPYGASGKASALKQVAQDTNALTIGGIANYAARTQAKGGAIYNNRGWDLVDASKEKDFDLAKIRKDELPKEMQNLTPEQQKQFIADKDKERGALQKQIGELGRKREDFINAELKKNNVNLDQALDEQIMRAIRNQATQRGFRF